jgi:hypothetical protein
MSDELALAYRQAMEDGRQYVGMTTCYMIEPMSRRALKITGHASPTRWGETIGAGRLIHRSVLDRLDGRLWPENATRGLDWRMTLRLQKHGIAGTDYTLSGPGYLVDVKGSGNMWTFDHVAKHTHISTTASYETVVQAFPADERARIAELEAARCPCCLHPHSW